MDEKEYPISAHLNDLRKRLWRAVIGVLIATFVAYGVSDEILYLLRRPIEKILGPNGHFVVLTPHEYFFAQMKVSLVFGLFFAAPWIFYQIWLFIAPGLRFNERRYALSFIGFSAGFFIVGAIFGYTVVFPPMFEFFVGTLPSDVQANYSIGLMFGFATKTLLGFAIVFEAPVVVFLLAKLGLVEVDSFRKYRRHMIVVAFILGAILTPSPDPISQTLMAIPLIILYEIGILAARIFVKENKNAEAV